uniref:Uncharacterized protein n=1 Tax=Solanum tuberosum TaxID=4113 RepID=M1C067_SOLTU
MANKGDVNAASTTNVRSDGGKKNRKGKKHQKSNGEMLLDHTPNEALTSHPPSTTKARGKKPPTTSTAVEKSGLDCSSSVIVKNEVFASVPFHGENNRAEDDEAVNKVAYWLMGRLTLGAYAYKTSKDNATQKDCVTSLQRLESKVNEIKNERSQENATTDADQRLKFHQMIQERYPTWNAYIKIQKNSSWNAYIKIQKNISELHLNKKVLYDDMRGL